MYPFQLIEGLDAKSIFTRPIDPIDGESYKYQLRPNDQFLLYSVGWNGRDDGGETFSQEPNLYQLNLNDGDWVWTYGSPVHSL